MGREGGRDGEFGEGQKGRKIRVKYTGGTGFRTEETGKVARDDWVEDWMAGDDSWKDTAAWRCGRRVEETGNGKALEKEEVVHE